MPQLPDPFESMKAERPPATGPPTRVDNSLAGTSSGERARAAAPRALPREGDTIGAFKVVSEIARGGMGVIYRVKRAGSPTGAEHALKLVNDAALDAEGLARFQREMEALGRVSGHPNVIRVSTSGVDPAGRPYYVMELVTGRSLHERVSKEGPLDPFEVAEIGKSLARALEHIHAQGIVHRDLKPANVLLREEDGTPVLTDFGLASHATSEGRLTRTQDILGTPVYMAPEQALGRSIDPRSDVYGLGAVLFTACSGEPPVPLGQQLDVLSRVAMGQLTPLSKAAPNLPPELAEIIERALATRPEDRYQSAASMAAAFERLLGDTPTDSQAEREKAEEEAAAPSGPSRLAPLIVSGLVIVAGSALLSRLVPRALEIRARDGLAKAGKAASLAGQEELAQRASACENALGAGKTEAAVAALDGADRALVEIGVEQAQARDAVRNSRLAELGQRALLARAAWRLEQRAPDAKAALADLERACALGYRPGGPKRSELAAARADALVLLGRDAEAEGALADGIPGEPVALQRSVLRARLGRLQAAALEVEEAGAQEIEEPCLEGILLRFELAIARGTLDEARRALGELSGFAGAPPLEVALAQAALARAERADSPVKAEDLKKLPRSSSLDAARIELALATADPLEARAHLEEAIAAAGDAGGRARAVRNEARLAFVSILRRTGDVEGAAARAAEAALDARSPRWRARVAVEQGRISYARDDLSGLEEAVSATGSAVSALPEAAALASLEAREATRRGLSAWTRRMLGAAEGFPVRPPAFADDAASWRSMRRARRALGVVQGATVEAAGRPHRDLATLLDLEGALDRAEKEVRAEKGGLRGWVERLIVEDAKDLRATDTRKHALLWLGPAVDEGRVALDISPDDPERIAILLEALVLSAPEPPPEALSEEVRRLAARLERLRGSRRETRLLVARAAVEVLGEPGRAVSLAQSVAREDNELAEPWRILARAHRKIGDDKSLSEDVRCAIEASAFELSIVRPFVSGLPSDYKKADAALRYFVTRGAIGAKTFESLVGMREDRARVREWIAPQREEHDAGREKLEAARKAADELADVSWREPDLRASLVWLAGTAREKLASDLDGRVHALAELAEGARRLGDRSLALLARVEALRQDARFGSELEKALENEPYAHRDGVWFGWEDGTLLRAAAAAARIKREGSAPPEDVARATEWCEQVLDADPASVPARVVRSFLLARAGRTSDAQEDLAQALAIAPDLEHPDEAPWISWIEELLPAAKHRTPERRR